MFQEEIEGYDLRRGVSKNVYIYIYIYIQDLLTGRSEI